MVKTGNNGAKKQDSVSTRREKSKNTTKPAMPVESSTQWAARPRTLHNKPRLVLVAAVLRNRVFVDEILKLHVVVQTIWCCGCAPRLPVQRKRPKDERVERKEQTRRVSMWSPQCRGRPTTAPMKRNPTTGKEKTSSKTRVAPGARTRYASAWARPQRSWSTWKYGPPGAEC